MVDRFEQRHVVRLEGLEGADATPLPGRGAAEVSCRVAKGFGTFLLLPKPPGSEHSSLG